MRIQNQLGEPKMSSNSDRNLLTFGVFLIIIVVGIVLAVTNLISWGLFVPVVLVLCGLWAIALGAMRSSQPQKYERGGFSTMAGGLGLIVLGAAWYLFGINWLYSLIVILLAIAALAIAAALKRK
jgi:hypothetical protein